MLLRKRRLRSVQIVTDDAFLRLLKEKHPDITDEKALRWRRDIAKILHIPVQKLSPSQTFEGLKKLLGSIDYPLAMNDLDEEISDLHKNTDLKESFVMPSTIGELIYELGKLK